MFRTSLCPSSGEQDRVLLHMVFCSGCAGCGCVELGRKLCAYAVIHGFVILMMGIMMPETCWDRSCVHTPYEPAPHNHSQHNQCRIPYAVIHSFVLLMMGIMMPETRWDRSLIINIGLVASCWFISLHPTFEHLMMIIGKLASETACLLNEEENMQNAPSTYRFIDINLSLQVLEPAQPPIHLVTAGLFYFFGSKVDAAWRSSLFNAVVNA